MYINNTTLLTGSSHLNPNGSTGIHLKTKEGIEYYHQKAKRFKDAKERNAFRTYRPFLEEELKELTDDLIFFLEDENTELMYNMSDRDKEGWTIYNILNDKIKVCKHFIKKMK